MKRRSVVQHRGPGGSIEMQKFACRVLMSGVMISEGRGEEERRGGMSRKDVKQKVFKATMKSKKEMEG